MKKVRCPECGTEVVWEGSEFRPFCSERCRTLDLGAWLGEHYRIPGEPAFLPPEEDDEGGS